MLNVYNNTKLNQNAIDLVRHVAKEEGLSGPLKFNLPQKRPPPKKN